ncbi:MAG: zinc ribbon domain-containing protein [Woeseiaceae bacterium]|nr:zinc ribbon domain-containing protein [Woeseiaceae bacterium]
MPIYEYACTNCDHSLDALQKISDEPLRDCPECGKAALKRKISAPRFRLKGSGWYETDFKKDNQRNVLKAETETPSGDKADSKSDKEKPAKAASKKESKTTSKADVE